MCFVLLCLFLFFHDCWVGPLLWLLCYSHPDCCELLAGCFILERVSIITTLKSAPLFYLVTSVYISPAYAGKRNLIFHSLAGRGPRIQQIRPLVGLKLWRPLSSMMGWLETAHVKWNAFQKQCNRLLCKGHWKKINLTSSLIFFIYEMVFKITFLRFALWHIGLSCFLECQYPKNASSSPDYSISKLLTISAWKNIR